MANEETKNLGLGVTFTAIVTDFGVALDQVKAKLNAVVREMETLSSKGAKTAQGLVTQQKQISDAAAKATEKIKENTKALSAGDATTVKGKRDAAKATDSYTESLAKNNRNLVEARKMLFGLDAATKSSIYSSSMHEEVFQALSKRLKGARSEFPGYKEGLVAISKETGMTAIKFNDLANALKNNEKVLLRSDESFAKVRARLGANALPKDLTNWKDGLDRVALAHDRLNGNISRHKGVIFDTSKSIVSFQHTLASLKKEFGPEIYDRLAPSMGNYLKSMTQVREEAKHLFNQQRANTVGMINAEKAIRTTASAMNQLGLGGDSWAKGVNKSAVASSFLRNELSLANGTLLEMGKSFGQTKQKAEETGVSFKKNLSPDALQKINSQLGVGITSWKQYESALKGYSDRATEGYKASRELANFQAYAEKAVGKHATVTEMLNKRMKEGYFDVGQAKKYLNEYITSQNLAKNSTADVAKQNAILSTSYREVVNGVGSFSDKAKASLATLDGTVVQQTKVREDLKRLQSAFLDTQKQVNSYNKVVAELGVQSPKTGQFLADLKNKIDTGNLSHAEAIKQVRSHGKELRNLQQEGRAVSGFWSNLSGKLIGGGAATKGASDYFSRLGQAVGSLTAWMPAAMIIGAFTTAVTSAIMAVTDFHQSLKSLQAISQGTDAEIALLGEEMLKVSNNSKYSLSEIAKGAIFIAQAGFTAGESLQVLGASARGAQGTLEPLTTAADLLTTIIRAFQLEARQASGIMDMLAVAANKSKTDLEGMRVVFNYLGPTAHAAGLSLSETLGSIMLLSNAGMRMSTIGTSLRQVFILLENPNTRLRKALDAVGMTLDDVSIKKKGLIKVSENLSKIINGNLSNAVQFFNIRAGNAALVISTLPAYLKYLTDSTLQYGAAAAMAGKQTEGLNVSIKILLNRFQNLFVVLSEGGITDLLTWLVKGLSAVLGLFTSVVGSLLGNFVLIGAAVSGIALLFKGLMAITAALTAGTLAQAGALGILTSAMQTMLIWAMLNPYTAIILGTTALITLIYTFIKSMEIEGKALQKKAILYTENAQTARNLSEALLALKKEQDSVKTSTDNYLVILNKIRETFPELSADIIRTNNDFEKQAVLLEEAAKKYDQLADAVIKTSVESLSEELIKNNAALEVNSKVLLENKNAWSVWFGNFGNLLALFSPATLLANLFGIKSGVDQLTRSQEAWAVAIRMTKSRMDEFAVSSIGKLSERNRIILDELASMISLKDKMEREPLILKFAGSPLEPLLRELIQLKDIEKEALKSGDYTDRDKAILSSADEVSAQIEKNSIQRSKAINEYEMSMLENRLKTGLTNENIYFNQKRSIIEKQYRIEADLISANWRLLDEKHKRTIETSKTADREKSLVARRLDELKKEQALVNLGYKEKEALDNLATEKTINNIQRVTEQINFFFKMQQEKEQMSFEEDVDRIKERQSWNDWFYSNAKKSFDDYLAHKKTFDLETYRREEENINKIYNETVKQINQELSLQGQTDQKKTELQRKFDEASLKKDKELAANRRTFRKNELDSAFLDLEMDLKKRLTALENNYAAQEILRSSDANRRSFYLGTQSSLNEWLYSQNLINAKEFYDTQEMLLKKETELVKQNLLEQYENFVAIKEEEIKLTEKDTEKQKVLLHELRMARLKFFRDIGEAEDNYDKKYTDLVRRQYDDWNKIYSDEGIFGVIKRRLQRNWEDFALWGDRIKEMADDVSNALSDSLGTFFEDVWTGQLKSAKEYFQSFASSIVKILADAVAKMIAKWLMWKAIQAGASIATSIATSYYGNTQGGGTQQTYSGSGGGLVTTAKGNAFDAGKIVKFAEGGVFYKPTLFKMANGTGLMGEAGPEAVMPLKRGSDGKLGVEAHGKGGGSTVLNTNINVTVKDSKGGDTESAKQTGEAISRVIKVEFQKMLIDERRPGGLLNQGV